jgi:hypothetical protein
MLIIALFTQSDLVLSWSLDTLCRITCVIKVRLHSEYCFVNRRYSDVDLLKDSVLMFEGFPLYLIAFLVCRLLFYSKELFVHSHGMPEFTHQCACGRCSSMLVLFIQELGGNYGRRQTQEQWYIKKVTQNYSEITARFCEKLIGRKNGKLQCFPVCAIKTCRHSRGIFLLIRKLSTKWRRSAICSGHFIREKLKRQMCPIHTMRA